eukprot:7836810-Pyramimonas_sp.AAC.1
MAGGRGEGCAGGPRLPRQAPPEQLDDIVAAPRRPAGAVETREMKSWITSYNQLWYWTASSSRTASPSSGTAGSVLLFAGEEDTGDDLVAWLCVFQYGYVGCFVRVKVTPPDDGGPGELELLVPVQHCTSRNLFKRYFHDARSVDGWNRLVCLGFVDMSDIECAGVHGDHAQRRMVASLPLTGERGMLDLC